MIKSKYIIVEDRGLEIPIVFSPLIQHKDIANPLNLKVISAGFCHTHCEPGDDSPIIWKTYGESISLQSKSRPHDGQVIDKMLALNV